MSSYLIHYRKLCIQLLIVTIMYCILNLDVSELLFPKVYYYDFIQSIDSTITSIVIPNWTCNDIDYTVFDFSRFIQIESIEIGNNCFGSVKTFKIEGLNRLKTIKIGNNSFTQKKNSWEDDKSKSFHILNCESLESIQIGRYSFSDCGGDFELRNLPKLQNFEIGTIDTSWYYSYNFCCSSLVIGGIDVILNIE